jgi:hypothetical protein
VLEMVCTEQLGQRTDSSRPLGPPLENPIEEELRMLAIDADSHFVVTEESRRR